MKTQMFAVLTATLALGACALDEDAFDLPESSEPSADDEGAATASANGASAFGASASEVENMSASVLADGCYEMRAPIIAKVDFGAVPDCDFGLPAEWSAVRLIDASPWIADALTNMPLPDASPLKEFCKYEYEGAEELETAYFTFLEFANGSPDVDHATMATDCPVITQQSGDEGLNTTELRDAARTAFHTGVGALDANDLASVHDNPSHLYLLDTKQQGYGSVEPHSDNLRDMLTELVCAHDPGLCEDLIHQVLVTPRNQVQTAYEADWHGGGTQGFVHELNIGIVTAVQDWLKRNNDGDPNTLERGVINLSVGAPDHGLYATDPNYAPMQSVIEAARFAACYGLPIYAAAGNTSTAERSCNMDQGLMVPAVLENIDGPDIDVQCADWGYVPNWNTTAFPIEDALGLVTAVSGVDHVDAPLNNQRTESATRLAALGARAIGPNGSELMTGTSVSTAVVAATAQLMATAAPELTGEQINDQIVTSGWPLNSAADAGRHVGEGRYRLSMCASLDEALGGSLSCAAQPPNPALLDSFELATDNAISAAMKSPNPETHQLYPGAHQSAQLSCLPETELEMTRPLPERPVCSSCSTEIGGATNGSGDEALFMSIATQTVPEEHEVINAYLHIYDSTSTLLDTISLSPTVVDAINEADPTYVIEVTYDEPTTATAELEFIYQNMVTGQKKSQSNPLTVL